MKYGVIIPAAGSGKRMAAGRNKLLIELDGRPVILHTLAVFEQDPMCEKIIMVIQPNDERILSELIKSEMYHTPVEFVYGGDERQHSVYNGLQNIEEEIVLVHDGARPFIRVDTIGRLVEKASVDGAAIAAVPVKDTIKKAENNEVLETIERKGLWQIQTPQAFRLSILKRAHEKAKQDAFLGTDESSLAERIGIPVHLVESDYDNIKLTTPEDLFFAEAIVAKRASDKHN